MIWFPEDETPAAGQDAGHPWFKRKAQQQKAPPQDGEPDDGRDPDPAWMHDGAEEKRPVSERIVLTPEDRRNAKAFIALLYGPVADTLYTLDPFCFGELDSNASGIIDAINDCVLASPKVARMVSKGALVPYIKLAQVLWPVAKLAVHHHILKDVETEIDRENKTITVRKQDWAMYTAA